MFRAKTKSGDKCPPNIPENSLIIIDNAPYHSMHTEKAPTTATKKADMIKWLQEKKITCYPDFLKSEIYEIIEQHKPRENKYLIDQIAAKHGYTVVRLPPYHCDLNPIELIWANIQNYVARRNSTWKMVDVERLCTEAINKGNTSRLEQSG